MDSPKHTPSAGHLPPLGPLEGLQGGSSEVKVGSSYGRHVQRYSSPELPKISRHESVRSDLSGSSQLFDRSARPIAQPSGSPYIRGMIHDPSCEIDPKVENDTVEIDGSWVQVKEVRDELLGQRAALMAEQRTLLAQEYMKEQGAVFLKALSDPEFAQANDITVVLEVGGRAVHLVPPVEGQGISDADMELYRSYVLSSTANTLNRIPSLKSLRADMKENDKVFKKTKKTLKKLGVQIDLKLQKRMLRENTRIVIELGNLSGVVYGAPANEVYLPDDLFKSTPKSTLQPSGFHVKIDEPGHVDIDHLDEFGVGADLEDELILTKRVGDEDARFRYYGGYDREDVSTAPLFPHKKGNDESKC